MSNAMIQEPVHEAPAATYDSSTLDNLPTDTTMVEPAVQPEERSASGMFQLFRKYASVSDLLRYAGAVSVAVAMGLFLIDGAAQFTDLQRFLTMLGFTAALTAAGFVMSLLVKEQRGSRAFMMLSLLSVPVNFTVFGALLYSFMPLDGLAQNYPGFALWEASSTDVVTAMAAGLAVLVPVVWMSTTVLARTARNWLTASLLVSSAVLVIPVRQEIIIAVLAVLSACALWWFVRRNSKDSLALKTIEGKFAVALLFVPPIVLIARGLFLYEASGVLVLMLSAGAYLILRQMLVAQKQPGFLAVCGTLLATLVALVASTAATDVINQLIRDDLAVVFGIGGFLVLNHDLVKVSPNESFAKTVGIVAATLSVCALVALSLLNGDAMVTAMCIATLAAMTTYGFMRSYLSLSVIAMCGIAAISMMHIESMWALAMQTGWWGIASAGAIAIVAGSLIDRAGTVVVEKA